MKTTMLRNNLAAKTLLTSGLAFGEVSLSFEYRGVVTHAAGQPREVHCKVIRRGDDLYVESSDGRIIERYLQIGDRALWISFFKGDESFARLTDAGLFRSIGHIPYLPDVRVLGDLGLEVDQQTTFLQLTSGSLKSVAESPGEIFRMPVVRRSQVGQDTKVYARLEEAVWAEVTQGDFVQVGPWEIPGRSVERYRDGRGEFRYELSLVQAGYGPGVPELPTFETLLNSVATGPFGVGEPSVHIEDVRRSPPLAFRFYPNRGSFDEQLAEGRRVEDLHAAYRREGARLVWQRRAPWLVGLAGALGLGIGAVVYWRRRGTLS